jgi:hypothetical protein
MESRASVRLDRRTHEELPANLQEFRSRGMDVLLIRGVKEEICKALRVGYFPESLCCTRGSVLIMRVK